MKRKTGLRDKLYWRWYQMISRCENPRSRPYKRYGGRGISVCNEWHWFEGFEVWAAKNGFDGTKTLERIDNNGNYEPSNCCWATRKEQALNRNNTVKVDIEGNTYTIAQLSSIYGFHPETLRLRLKAGLSPLDAVSNPLNRGRSWAN